MQTNDESAYYNALQESWGNKTFLERLFENDCTEALAKGDGAELNTTASEECAFLLGYVDQVYFALDGGMKCQALQVTRAPRPVSAPARRGSETG